VDSKGGSGVMDVVPRRVQQSAAKVGVARWCQLKSGQSMWQTWVPMELLCLRCYNKPPFTTDSDFISISWMVGLDSLVPRAHA